MGADAGLPFWQVNVPPERREEECPEYLLGLSEKDEAIIGTRDEDFEYMQWPQVIELIETNRIDLFVRKPTDLRNYREYTHRLVREHGSIMSFILTSRLAWTDPTPAGAPFAQPSSDVAVRFNDWPYGVDPRSVAHLVVWTKFALDEDPATGDLTPAARALVERFVDATFRARVPQRPGDVAWFKNWQSLKSVHAVEHFHVMMRDPPPGFLEGITGGDVPLARKVAGAAGARANGGLEDS